MLDPLPLVRNCVPALSAIAPLCGRGLHLWNVLHSLSAWLLVAVRAALGLAQGVLFPCLNPMLVRWSPQNEQNKGPYINDVRREGGGC